MSHKEWLDREYSQWVKALQESTVHNFKEHPMVKRMLGNPSPDPFFELIDHRKYPSTVTQVIDQLGTGEKDGWPTYSLCMRYIYYAQQLLQRNPSSICEIGGGVGQFYAILRALGYKGDYYIFDLPPVKLFQRTYLSEVSKQTGLSLKQRALPRFDMVVSFYAFGEFDDDTKQHYHDTVFQMCDHGYIVFNPHSGASDDTNIFPNQATITPGIEPGIKIIEW